MSAPHEELAPAKLTWSLRVLGRRDGLHLLEAEMVALDLCDVVEFHESDRTEVDLVLEPPASALTQVPVTDTLVARALDRVGRRARVLVRKRIPPGAGLGGGSADAAAVLRWAGVHDLGTAASLGSDVPFCVVGGRAMVRGTGEDVAALPPRRATVTLALLAFGVDTAACYRAFDELPEGARHHERNDLTAAAEVVAPALAEARAALEAECGCDFVLAGSGSTLFCEGDPLGLGPGGSTSVASGAGTALLVVARTG